MPQTSTQAEYKEQRDQPQRGEPPNPMDAARFGTGGTKLLLYKIVVVELLVGDAEMAGVGGSGPAGRFICAATRTGLGLGRHHRAAVGTNLGRHLLSVEWGIRSAEKWQGAAGNSALRTP